MSHICDNCPLRFKLIWPVTFVAYCLLIYLLFSFTHDHAAEPPKITSQPSSLEEGVYEAVFTVEATGTEPLSYQWQSKSNPDEGDWQNICNRSSLRLSGVHPSSVAQLFRCVVSNSAGSAISQIAYLIDGKYCMSQLSCSLYCGDYVHSVLATAEQLLFFLNW